MTSQVQTRPHRTNTHNTNRTFQQQQQQLSDYELPAKVGRLSYSNNINNNNNMHTSNNSKFGRVLSGANHSDHSTNIKDFKQQTTGFKPIQANDAPHASSSSVVCQNEFDDDEDSNISDISDPEVGSRKENLTPPDGGGGGGGGDSGAVAALDDANKQHHVGPVMGIFFKVWSLVKVTRGRHHHNQKMRRQNSEADTGQFQYISGDQYQLAASGSANNGGNSNHSRNSTNITTIGLEDAHFRRAGSQPAPSSCIGRQPAGPLFEPILLKSSTTSTNATTTPPAIGRLQVLTSAASTCSSTATAGTSTSSGISSSTSSTFAPTSAGAGSDGIGNSISPPHASGVKRHLSAYSLRKGAPSLPAPISVVGGNFSSQQQQQQQQQQQRKPLKSSSGWTSKIKRSTTSVNQADVSSYTSRFRFASNRNQQQQQRQVSPPVGRNSLNLQQLQQQQQQRQQQEQEQKQPVALIDWAAGNKNFAGQTADIFGGECEAAANSSEEDSNDIYSTPNDSIQSVPSTAQAPGGRDAADDDSKVPSSTCSSGGAATAGPQTAYPIIKSFSTTNFSQLVQQQQQQQPIGQKFRPIDEHSPANASGGGCVDLQRQDSGRSGESNESCCTKNNNNNKRLSGSRFFISSSSSEDSNSPSQQQHNSSNSNHNHKHCKHQQNPPQSSIDQLKNNSQQLEQHHGQLALSSGVHYHHHQHQQVPTNTSAATRVQRPDSLLMGASGCNAPFGAQIAGATAIAHGPTLATPTPNSSILITPVSVRSQFGGSLQSPLADICAIGTPGAPPPPSVLSTTHNSNSSYLRSSHYRRSPSLFEISRNQQQNPESATASSIVSSNCRPASLIGSRFSSRYPLQSAAIIQPAAAAAVSSFKPVILLPTTTMTGAKATAVLPSDGVQSGLPNSISLHDCKLSNQNSQQDFQKHREQQQLQNVIKDVEFDDSEYKLAQMLVEFGSNPSARDSYGYTVLMQAIMSDNLPTIKCLIERGVDLNETNHAGLGALDLACSRAPTAARLEVLKLLIDNRADLDRAKEIDGTRLLDRLIAEHQINCQGTSMDKLPFIDCLLQNGAKLGSATWLAAQGKHEIQLRLLKKLCQDGYFLYKKSSIEAAVYRFEYALKRIAELEQQLAQLAYRHSTNAGDNQLTAIAARQIKYQTYLGLSRCERKRRFYKRALEFAHMAILVDSTSYEGYYSKAHILKDLGEIDDSLMAIDQTSRLVDKSIEGIQFELKDLQQQEEALIYDGCFNLLLDSRRSSWFEATRLELNGNLDYLQEAKKYIAKLRSEILEDKLSATT